MMRALALAMILMAAPAAAEPALGLPQGCAAFLTVQTAQCSVVHKFICAQDPANWRRAVEIDASGYDFLTVTDTEGQWLEIGDSYAGTYETMAGGTADPPSLTELMATGADTYDFEIVDQNGNVTRHVGQDKLSRQSMTVDGTTLLAAATEMTASDINGTGLWSVTATFHIDAARRLILGGVSHWIMPDEAYTTDTTPMALILPGEPGFLSTTAQFGCGG